MATILIPDMRDRLVNLREKVIMDFYLGEDSNGDMLWKQDEILSIDLKKMAGCRQGETIKRKLYSHSIFGISC